MAESQPEREFLGSSKARLWTYLILGIVLTIGVVVANFALKNPELASRGLHKVMGLPAWAIPLATAAVGALVFWLGLKIETDWPEALGAFLIAGSVAGGEFILGWNRFVLGGVAAIPYANPVLVFLVLLVVGMTKSR
jgi:hypothetical protein